LGGTPDGAEGFPGFETCPINTSEWFLLFKLECIVYLHKNQGILKIL
jgi:hypothetical protein